MIKRDNFFRRVLLLNALLISTMLSSGCSIESSSIDPSSGEIKLIVPDSIVMTRAVNQNNLRAEILIDDRFVAVVRNGDNWQGSLNLTEGTYQLSVSWFESINEYAQNGSELKLAELSQEIQMGSSNTNVSILLEDYDTQFDRDDDGLSNIEERRTNTNPFDPQSPRTDGVNVLVPFISRSDAPVMDGLFDNIWNSARFSDVAGETLSVNNLITGSDVIRQDGESEFRWAAMHDETNLYVLVLFENVEGSALFGDSENPLDDDNLRLYWDGNNSGKTDGSVYDQFDDYALRIPLLKDATSTTNRSESDGRIFQTTESVQIPTGLEFATCGCIAGQHIWEIRIPFSSAGIVSRQPMGFEIQIDDDQDGGERDASWAWFESMGSATTADSSPSVFGTIMLE